MLHSEPVLAGIRILVVENHLDTRELYDCVLKGVGAEVLTVSSAAEALAALPHLQPDFLVSEIALPGEDGYSLLGKLRALEAGTGKHIPTIAVSSYTLQPERFLSPFPSFQKWLSKPIDFECLVETIVQVAVLEQQGQQFSF